MVDDKFVIEDMIRIDTDPDLRCGTRRMTAQLQLMGYIINKKKVARLMKENGLTKKGRKQAKKAYARYRIVTPLEPLVVLEMDIKQVWIVRDRRSAYILTVLDTFTRETLAWIVGFSITSQSEVDMGLRNITSSGTCRNGLKRNRIEVRNDGGPQFAKQYRNILNSMGLIKCLLIRIHHKKTDI
ncbi:MAG: IS3 family transposase [Bacteroidetes bacterium]|nr:IS3 family transposase [Bacteroidota bacterium]